jgi:hypothetical protein
MPRDYSNGHARKTQIPRTIVTREGLGRTQRFILDVLEKQMCEPLWPPEELSEPDWPSEGPRTLNKENAKAVLGDEPEPLAWEVRPLPSGTGLPRNFLVSLYLTDVMNVRDHLDHDEENGAWVQARPVDTEAWRKAVRAIEDAIDGLKWRGLVTTAYSTDHPEVGKKLPLSNWDNVDLQALAEREALPPVDEVRRLRNSKGLTFKEIGSRYGKTPQWAHQLYTHGYGSKFNREYPGFETRKMLLVGLPPHVPVISRV